jgi:hypothetical protein
VELYSNYPIRLFKSAVLYAVILILAKVITIFLMKIIERESVWHYMQHLYLNLAMRLDYEGVESVTFTRENAFEVEDVDLTKPTLEEGAMVSREEHR